MWILLAITFLGVGTVTQVSSQVIKCDVPGDVIFILDGSKSIDPLEWNRTLNFVQILIEGLDVEPLAIHVGVIVYSTFIGDVIGLNPYLDKATLKERVMKLTQPADGTDTAKGIHEARKMFRSQGRMNTPHIAVVITDGRSKKPGNTMEEARAAKSYDGVTMIAVGVGDAIFMDELAAIATSERKLFNVTDFRSLPGLVASLRESICWVITTTTSTSTTTTTSTTTMTPLPPEVLDCNMPADVVFVLDGSETIEAPDWMRTKYFVASLINSLNVHPAFIHVGMIVYSTFIGDVIPLTPFKDKNRLKYLAGTLTHPRFGTNTALGLSELRKMMATQGRRRQGTPQIAIVLTDGQSQSPNDTIIQARQAQAEGVIMITVAIGDSVYMPELENMASSKRKLFSVQDFRALAGLVQTLKELICKAITTTPTPLVTTPLPPIVMPELCTGCLIDNGIGYNPYPEDCGKYVQCYREGDGYKAMVRPCPFGQYWDASAISCRPAELVTCPRDPCNNRPDNAVHSSDGNGCRAYWRCMNGNSIPSCCPMGSRYLANVGCVHDPTCKIKCPPDSDATASDKCTLKPHPDRRNYIQTMPGYGDIVRPCAPGSVYSHDLCSCIMAVQMVNRTRVCKPAVHYKFDSGVVDQSGNNVQAGVTGVRVNGRGQAVFTGSSVINIWRFAGVDFGSKLAIKVRYRMGAPGAVTGHGIKAQGPSHRTVWFVISEFGDILRTGEGEIPASILYALKHGTLSGVLLRQIIHYKTTTGPKLIWQILSYDGYIINSGDGMVTPEILRKVGRFSSNKGMRIVWFVYGMGGSVIRTGNGDIPDEIFRMLQDGTLQGTLVKQSATMKGENAKWQIISPTQEILKSGTGQITKDIIIQFIETGQRKMWYVYDKDGKTLRTGMGEVPNSVLISISQGSLPGTIVIYTLRGGSMKPDDKSTWHIMLPDGTIKQSGSGVLSQTHLIKLIQQTSYVWYILDSNGSILKSGYDRVPEDILKSLKQGTMSGTLVKQDVIDNGALGQWRIMDQNGQLINSGQGKIPLNLLQLLGPHSQSQMRITVRQEQPVIDPSAFVVQKTDVKPDFFAGSMLPGSQTSGTVSSGTFGQTGQTVGGISGSGLPGFTGPKMPGSFAGTGTSGSVSGTPSGTWPVPGQTGSTGTGWDRIMKSRSSTSGSTAKQQPSRPGSSPTGPKMTDEIKRILEGAIAKDTGSSWVLGSRGMTGQTPFSQPKPSRPSSFVPSRVSGGQLPTSAFSGTRGLWYILAPTGSIVQSGSGTIPADILSAVSRGVIQGALVSHSGVGPQARWKLIQAGGKVQSGTGEIPNSVLQSVYKTRVTVKQPPQVKVVKRWQMKMPDGSVKTGTGPIPQNLIQGVMQWTLTKPDGSVQTGTGTIPQAILNGPGSIRINAQVPMTGPKPQTVVRQMMLTPDGKIIDSAGKAQNVMQTLSSIDANTPWKITSSDGKVRTGTGPLPPDLMAQLRAQMTRSVAGRGGSQTSSGTMPIPGGSGTKTSWTIRGSDGSIRRGSGALPDNLRALMSGKTGQTGGRVSMTGTMNLPSGFSGSTGSRASWRMSGSDGSARSGTGSLPQDILNKLQGQMSGAAGGQAGRVVTGSGTVGSTGTSGTKNIGYGVKKIIGPLQYDLVPIRGRMRSKRNAHRGKLNPNPHQALITNCNGRDGDGPSIMILAGRKRIVFSLKTERTSRGAMISLPARPGYNDIQLLYDGTKMKGIVNGREKTIPLSGNIQRRQAGLLLGACQGFRSFTGEIDEFSMYPCLP